VTETGLHLPGDDEIQLCLVRQSEADCADLLETYRELVTQEEYLKATRFRFDEHRNQYLITRALIRTVLSGYSGIDPRAWRFATNAYGRPHIEIPDVLGGLSFNIAHTAGLIVCACTAAARVGVDAEIVRLAKAPLEVADRYFSPTEVAELRALPLAAQPERFFQYWTLKESYIKATGKGLSTPLDQFTFRLEQAGCIELSFGSGLNDDPQRWRSWLLEPIAGYLVALTVERGPQRIVARKVVPLRDEEAFECRVVAMSA
jgi:4'-phosphopantetheinyl transferase